MFADDSEDGCEPGSWDKCPANIGDLHLVVTDPSLLTYDIRSTQPIEMFEVMKGSAGNMIDNAGGIGVNFSHSHNLMPGVGIEMHKMHTISCSYSPEALRVEDATGSFELSILNEHILLDALTPFHELVLLVMDALNLTHPVSIAGSTHGTICHLDPGNPVMTVTKLTFTRENGPIPNFFVSPECSVVVTANNLVDAVDKVDYLGSGHYLVTYTPTVTGHYFAVTKLNSDSIWTDLSKGVFASPAKASAHYRSHNSNLVAIAGKEESYAVVACDQFGNSLL